MRRREFVAIVGAAASWPFAALAQQTAVPLIGFLDPGDRQRSGARFFRKGLQDLGYIDGQNIRIEYRWADGDFARLPSLAADLARAKVNVLVANVTQAALAAKDATSTIPIVMIGVADPVGVGLVASLSHPGGNITGTSSLAADIVGKQLETLLEIRPSVSHIAVLWNPKNAAFNKLQMKEVEIASREKGIDFKPVEATSPNDFRSALETVSQAGLEALLVLVDPVFVSNANLLMENCLRRGLLVMSGNRTLAVAGALASYGPNYEDLARRSAFYVDKILKGTKPADLPVEQPVKFDFVLNLRTANALNIKLPAALQARADEVVE